MARTIPMRASPVATDPSLEARALRKVTWRLMPVLLLSLFISYVDRANLGVIFTPLSKDLGLSAASIPLGSEISGIQRAVESIAPNIGCMPQTLLQCREVD
ncbi:MAG: transporter [Frankiales bacterium]|nr:transporter [Frankiales bacterium]